VEKCGGRSAKHRRIQGDCHQEHCPVGNGSPIAADHRRRGSGSRPLHMASNPEFLREGSAIEDFMPAEPGVIGLPAIRPLAILKDLYSPLYLIETPSFSHARIRELIKYAANAFLATRSPSSTKSPMSARKWGGRATSLSRGMGSGSAHRPQIFCIRARGRGAPVSPKIRPHCNIASQKGYQFEIVRAVIRVNREQRGRMVAKIKEALDRSRGKKIAILGLGQAQHRRHAREAPALKSFRPSRRGRKIRAYDPKAMEKPGRPPQHPVRGKTPTTRPRAATPRHSHRGGTSSANLDLPGSARFSKTRCHRSAETLRAGQDEPGRFHTRRRALELAEE